MIARGARRAGSRAALDGGGVQERDVTAVPDARGDRPDQPPRQPLPAVGRVGAHRADLGPAGRVHPLPRHRDERAAAADAEVGAEGDGAGQERAGLGAGDEVEHLGDVGGPSRTASGSGPRRPGAVHLHAGDGPGRVPTGRRFAGRRARQRRRPAPPARRGRPSAASSGARVTAANGETSAGVARRPAAALGQVRLWAGQRRPQRVVEGMGHALGNRATGPPFPDRRRSDRQLRPPSPPTPSRSRNAQTT